MLVRLGSYKNENLKSQKKKNEIIKTQQQQSNFHEWGDLVNVKEKKMMELFTARKTKIPTFGRSLKHEGTFDLKKKKKKIKTIKGSKLMVKTRFLIHHQKWRASSNLL